MITGVVGTIPSTHTDREAKMTYRGGVEDGKSYIAAQILRLINRSDLTKDDKLEDIARACRLVLKDPTRREIPGFAARCPECLGQRSYYTEWSDSAEADPKLKALVLHYPDPEDGTVLIKCTTCNDDGLKRDDRSLAGWADIIERSAQT
jgi:hypothetical protein